MFTLSPGGGKVNLHSIYAEPERPTDRSELTAKDFAGWIAWAREKGFGLDYNGSFFAHPMMDNSLSLSSPKEDVRKFWIRHGITSREISAAMGKATGQTCVHNIWIPDGLKDIPADRYAYRNRLTDSLDQIFKAKLNPSEMVDTLEGKLFGIGVESFTVGSHEF